MLEDRQWARQARLRGQPHVQTSPHDWSNGGRDLHRLRSVSRIRWIGGGACAPARRAAHGAAGDATADLGGRPESAGSAMPRRAFDLRARWLADRAGQPTGRIAGVQRAAFRVQHREGPQRGGKLVSADGHCPRGRSIGPAFAVRVCSQRSVFQSDGGWAHGRVAGCYSCCVPAPREADGHQYVLEPETLLSPGFGSGRTARRPSGFGRPAMRCGAVGVVAAGRHGRC